MKNVLLGTSALVAVGLMSSGAMAADPISLGLSGNMAVAFGVVSEDDSLGQPGYQDRDHALAQSGEVHFTGSTTLDNGISVRVVIELEGQSSGDEIDENFIRISGENWGTIELGGRDGAAGTMRNLGPGVDFNHMVGAAEFSYINGGSGSATSTVVFATGRSSDSPKISYYSPRINGIQVGASYEPEPGADGGVAVNGTLGVAEQTSGANDGRTSEYMEAGINYVGSFGDAAVRLSGVYSKGQQEQTPTAGQFLDDDTLWHVGAQASFGSFAIGGAYQRSEVNTSDFDQATGDRLTYRIAGTWSTGPWLIGLAYAKATTDDMNSTALRSDDTTVWGATAKRTMGPGITASIGIRLWDIADDDNAAAAENTATNVFIATRVGF